MLRFDNNGTLVSTKVTFPARDSDFDVIIRPSEANSEFTREYFSANKPNTNCNICHRSAKDCLTHRIGLKIPFNFVNPTMSYILSTILKTICMVYDEQNKVFRGCGSIRSETNTTACPNCGLNETYKYVTAYKIYKEIKTATATVLKDNLPLMSTICYKTVEIDDREKVKVKYNGIEIRKFINFSDRIAVTDVWKRTVKHLNLSPTLRLSDFITNIVAVLPTQLRSFAFTVDTNQAFNVMFEKIREMNITIKDKDMQDLYTIKAENSRSITGIGQIQYQALTDLDNLVHLLERGFTAPNNLHTVLSQFMPLTLGSEMEQLVSNSELVGALYADETLDKVHKSKLFKLRRRVTGLTDTPPPGTFDNLEDLVSALTRDEKPSDDSIAVAIGLVNFDYEEFRAELSHFVKIPSYYAKNIAVLLRILVKTEKLLWSLSVNPVLSERVKLRLYAIWRAETGNTQVTASDINGKLISGFASGTTNFKKTTDFYGLAIGVFEEILKVMPPTYAKSDAKNKDNTTLFMMLPDKTGLYRDTILAKQTTNCSRTVVGPSDERFGDFDIPYYYITLQVIEDVNKLTIDYVKDLAQAGMVRYIRKTGADKFVLYDEKSTPIEKGDKIYRAILPGDPVIMNRQPTLHQHSVMAHHIQFTRDPVVRLHPMCTKSYAADFDGDEMNTFIAMSTEARLELMMFLHCNHMIISGNKPLIGPMFHELAMLYHLGRKADVEVPYDLFAYYVSLFQVFDYEESLASRLKEMNVPSAQFKATTHHSEIPVPSTEQISLATNVYRSKYTAGAELPGSVLEQVYHNKTFNTYRKLLSLLFPPDFSYPKVVKNGILIGTKLDDSNISIGRGHIVHVIHHRYGYKTCARFLTYITHLCSAVMRNAFVSMKLDYFGLGINKVDFGAITDTISSIKIKIEDLQQKQDAEPSLLKRAMYEDSIKNLAGSYQSTIKNVVSSHIDPDDGFSVLIASGARGNFTALQQISMSVGQQYNGSQRVDATELPYVRDSPDLALKHGFLIGNFNDGMSPVEMMIHAVPVRGSIIAAKMEVKDVGDMANRIATCLGGSTLHESLATYVNGRRLSNNLGGHMDPAKLIEVGLPTGEKIMTFLNAQQDLF